MQEMLGNLPWWAEKAPSGHPSNMDEPTNPKEELEAKVKSLSEWISDYRFRTIQLPQVQQSLDIAKYQLGVFSTIPSGLPDVLRDEIAGAYCQSRTFWSQFTAGTTVPALSGLALEI